MSCNARMLNQPQQNGGACSVCEGSMLGGKKKPRSSAKRSYRKRVSKSKCKGKRASTCRNSKLQDGIWKKTFLLQEEHK